MKWPATAEEAVVVVAGAAAVVVVAAVEAEAEAEVIHFQIIISLRTVLTIT
jgi:hypothetical protein